MSQDLLFIIQPEPHPSRKNAILAVQRAEVGQYVTIRDETRSQAQNKMLWPILTLWAKRIQMAVNGNLIYVTKEAWKIAHLADFRHEQGNAGQFALTPGGLLVPLGFETHTMPKGEFAEFLTYLLAETGNRGMELPPRAAEECQGYIQKHIKEQAA